MELLLGLLAFGTGWFWGYLLIWFFLLTAFVENEKASWALFTTIVGLAGLVFLGNSGVIPWIIKNPLWAGAYIVGYVVVGIVWGFFKWGFYLSKIGGKYERPSVAQWARYEA
jgi:hypothetical protein